METHGIEVPPGLAETFEKVTLAEVKAYQQEFPKIDEGKIAVRPKMNPMQNYSKRSVRRGQWQANGVEAGLKKVKECHLFDKVPVAKELCPFVGSNPDTDGWVRVKGVMDSGASECVAPPTMCPHYPIVPSVGSEAGQKYMCASEELIPNLGEQRRMR